MNEDHLTRYLSDTADAITLPPADLAGVARRGRNRRTRRRVGLVGAVAAVAVVAASVTFRDADKAPVESAMAASVVPSNLDWTVVSPASGLGIGRSSAVVDGVVYSLSTAPGPHREGTPNQTRLYRSSDGAEWAEVSLPDGVAVSSLAAADGALYAVGTAPAGGGGRDLVVASSRDGASSWSLVTLPSEIAALEEEHPDRVVISQPSIASVDGTNVVAAVVVTASPNWSIVDDLGGDISWEQTETGIDVYDVSEVDHQVLESGAATTLAPSDDAALEAGRVAQEGAASNGRLVGSYSWGELGITPELEPYLDGRTFVHTSSDGQTFEPVEIPAQGWGAQVVAVDGAYRMFVSTSGEGSGEGSTTVLSSTDGRSWQIAGELPGFAVSAGVLGDRPAFAGYTTAGQEAYVEIGGIWTSLDLSSALPEGHWVADVAFGPLGMLAVAAADGGNGFMAVHSSDGTTISVVDLADLVDLSDKSVAGIGVSADAFAVRLAVVDGDAGTVPEQQVVIGTPR